MPDNKDQTTVKVAPAVADPVSDTGSDSSTQPEIEVTTPPSNEEHVVEVVTDSPSEDSTTEPKHEDKGEETDYKEKFERLSGKVSELEKTKSTKRRVANLTQTELEGLNKRFDWQKGGTKAEYEKFRKEFVAANGEDPGEYETLYGAQQGNSTTQQNSETTNVAPTMTPEQVIQLARSSVRQEMQMSDGMNYFFEKVPSMAPPNIPDNAEAKEEAEAKVGKVGILADALLKVNPSLSDGEAMVQAWNNLPENAGKQIENARMTGELTGMAKANARNSGSSVQTAGGSTGGGSSTTVRMNSEQKEVYDRMLKTSPGAAAHFARNVAKGDD